MTRPHKEATSAQSVTVRLVTGQALDYPWATAVRVDRKGGLRVLEGWKQRAYHPRDEWLSYSVGNARLTGALSR